jgi:adenosylmethionine-8-amino-7-oxononanoate aminotransferase
MALMYHHLAGDIERRKLLSFTDGYHGATVAAAHLTDLRMTVSDAGPASAEAFVKLPTPRRPGTVGAAPTAEQLGLVREEMLRTVEEAGPRSIAALFVEPILGIGGVVVIPDSLMRFLRDVCSEHGILLVADEVLTGFGRTGKLFACEHSGVVPDIMLNSKGLSGGYCPLSSVTTSERIYRQFAHDDQLGGFRHGHTNSGHATACAVALAVLDVIERGDLVESSCRLGHRILTALEPLLDTEAAVDVRGRGLLIGMELRDPATAAKLATDARHQGVIVRVQGAVVSAAPPLNLEEEEADLLAGVLLRAMKDT